MKPSSVLILSLAARSRYLDNTKNKPALLEERGGNLLMNWLLAALNDSEFKDISIACEYHLEKLISEFPDFKYFFPKNNAGDNTASLILAGQESLVTGGLIIDSGIVMRKQAVSRMSKEKGKIIAGYELVKNEANIKTAKLAYKNGKICLPSERGSDPIYFSGLIKLSKNSVESFLSSVEELSLAKKSSLEDILVHLINKGEEIDACDISDEWAKIHRPKALSNFIFGTKAETLERLYGNIKNAIILPQIKFSVGEWEGKSDSIISSIFEKIESNEIVIRSSSLSEDSFSKSNAGSFTSLLAVPKKAYLIFNGVEEVIRSYLKEGQQKSSYDQVLIQPYLNEISLSGVILTTDQSTKAPYLTVNYERDSGTDGVTSGTGKNQITEIILRKRGKATTKQIQRLYDLSEELTSLLDLDELDIEFAIDKKGLIYLLQVRPLITQNIDPDYAIDDFYEELDNAKNFVSTIIQPSFGVCGGRSILANMPDWNPAEIIGNRPRPLAYSLYKVLITDDIWAKARHHAGYKDLGANPLMHQVAGHPFIDVRASFNSFLPSDLEIHLSEKLINFYLLRLEEYPELHDKIEFDIVPTCLDFDFKKFEKIFLENDFLIEEINHLRNELKLLTEGLIKQEKINIKAELNLVMELDEFRENQLLESNNETYFPLIINQILQQIKSKGTLPFSKLARNGFIAISFLRSLVARKIFTQSEYDSILRSIPTVASNFTEKVNLLNAQKLELDKFLEEFGHLRPGTYDILSPNYRDNADNYFLNKTSKFKDKVLSHNENFVDKIFSEKEKSVTDLIQEENFKFSVEDLKVFIKEAIPAREYSKFIFTKSLDQMFEYLKQWGLSLGLSNEELSYLSLDRVLSLSTASESAALANKLRREINFQRKRHKLIQAIRLPDVIYSPNDIVSFEVKIQKPNFVTNKSIEGMVIEISKNQENLSLENSIIMIENADPGYDWIFSHNIAGLITMYGGAASHMAIRAGEFQLPAAIGCGESIFNQLRGYNSISLDCANKLIRKIS